MPVEQTPGVGGSRGLRQPVRPLNVEFSVAIHPSVEGILPKVLESYRAMNDQARGVHEKYRVEHLEHIDKSRLSILTTADRALARVHKDKPKKALILGTGSCIDIPLEDLANRFDEVTLVDIDTKSTELAVKQLGPTLQKKVRIVAADVTGVIGEFTSGIEGIKDSSEQVWTFLSASTSFTDELDVEEKAPDLGNDYTFVSSHLLITQLANLPILLLKSSLFEKYGLTLSEQPGSNGYDLFMNTQLITQKLQNEHIAYLSRSVAPEGSVHIADTYARLTNSPFETEPDRIPLILKHRLDHTIDQHFLRTTPATGMWFLNYTPDDQRYAIIVPNSLDPKPQPALQ